MVVWSVASPSIIFAAAISPGGMNLATAESDGTVRLRGADTGQVESVLRGHKGPVYAVAFAPDGQTIASAGLDRTVKIWRTGTKELLESFDSGNTKQVNCLSFSPDGKTLAVGGEDQSKLDGPVIADGNSSTASKRAIHKARLFTAGSWKVLAVLAGHEGSIRQLAFSPDGKLLATAGDDETARIWNIADGKELAVLKNRFKTHCLAFSPDGELLAMGSEHYEHMWKLSHRGVPTSRALIGGNPSKIFSIAFSPDGNTLALGFADGTIKLWSIKYKALAEPRP